MFNSYNTNQKVEINAVSGTLVKNYKDSFILKFHTNSQMADKLFDIEPRVKVDSGRYVPVIVLQVMVSGNNELIAEVMRKEDFDKMFEMQTESEDKGMNIIDVAEIKKAVKDNQLVFFAKELCSRTFIFCKDTQTEECACVGEIKAESEEK